MTGDRDRTAQREATSASRLARRLARYLLMGVTLLASLAIGGAQPAIQVVLSLGVLLACAAWVIGRRGELRPSPFAPMALTALAGTLLQLVPLPGALVEVLSPRALEIRTDALGHRPSLLPLTLDVPATVLAALRGFALLGILVVTSRVTRWRGRTALFPLGLAFAGGAIGLISFVQRLAGAQSILGFYQVKDMPGSGFFGTFVNGNHASSFLALSALVALGCWRETTGRLRLALGVSAAISMLGVLSTGSRMGLIGLVAGVLVLGTWWLVNHLGPRRGLLVAGALAALAVPAAALLAVVQRHGSGGSSLALLLADQKLRGWMTAASVVRHYPLTGVGRGAFEGPAAEFRQTYEHVRLVFPENLLAQMLSEWGIPLTVAIVVLFAVPAIKVGLRIHRWEPMYQGAAAGVIAVLVHELADFGLELPGVAFPTAMALGMCAGRLQVSTEAAENQGARPILVPGLAVAFAAWGALLVAGVWAAPRMAVSEDPVARQLSSRRDAAAGAALRQMVLRHPADAYFALYAARQAIAAGAADAGKELNRAMRLFPQSPAPHLLAFHYLSVIGRRAQAAVEYRMAIERGHQFDYEQVVRRVGPAHVHRAVPQRPENLLNLAGAFAQAGRNKEAETASARAVELAPVDEAVRIRRLEVALATRDEPFIRGAAQELGRMATSKRGVELAVRGLAQTGAQLEARQVLSQVLKSNPEFADVAVRSARVLFEHGDVEGARALLAAHGGDDLPLEERIAVENLLADIATKTGNPDAAMAARVRARLLERRRQPAAVQ